MSANRGNEQRGFELRFFGIIAVIGATVVLMYGATFRYDPEVVSILLTATVMLVIGLTFGVLMTGVKFKFRDMSILEPLLWGSMSFGLILLVNRLIPIQFNVTSPISAKYLGVLVGVSEELFFRVFLCGVGSMFNKWGGILGSSLIWSSYHIYRYGGSIETLFLIGVVGCILGWIYLTSKLGDGVIFAHALVNYVAIQNVP